MGRDFKIGLICGVVLAGVALIWVATRPTLTTQARMFSPSPTASQDNRRPIDSLFTEQGETTAETPSPDRPPVAAPEGTTDVVQPQPLVREPDTTIYERDQKITTTRFHIVQKDETLSAISQQYYGTANQWRKILAANEESIKDANKIRPGTKLIIPQ